jgi:hypothetical protein
VFIADFLDHKGAPSGGKAGASITDNAAEILSFLFQAQSQ